jgi:hypothetical protein
LEKIAGFRVPPFRQQSGSEPLHSSAEGGDLPHIRRLNPANNAATAREERHQPLVLQLLEGLSNGTPTHPELFRQPGLDESLARPQSALQDGFSDSGCHVMA